MTRQIARAPARGLSLFGLALAGLALVGSVVGSVVATVVYAEVLFLGNLGHNGLARAVLVLAALAIVAPIGLPKALLAMRRLANLTRDLSRQWCRVPIAEPYALPSAGESSPGTWTWSMRALGQSATWRDAVWMMFVAPVASPLLLLPLVAPVCLGWYWSLPASHDKKPAVLALLGVATVASVYAGPSLLKGYGLLARSVLGRTTQAELARRVRHLAETRSESLDASAAELRRIERDLHDGAQARLVALGMTLGALDEVLGKDEAVARALLLEAQASSSKALGELRDLVRGIHPPVLADRGLVDAVRALALDNPLPVEVTAVVGGRLPAPVESAVYFAISELLTNATKHAGATRAWVELHQAQGVLRARVGDDGRGGADPRLGTGLHGIERRLAAFDGTLACSSPHGGPTLMDMEVPCELLSLKTSSS